MIRLKSPKDISQLKISGQILATVIESLKSAALPGVPLKDLDKKARSIIKEFGAIPAFLGYKSKKSDKPYPAAICASVNEKIVHGVPDHYSLKSGDVLKIDVGINYRGYITDGAVTIGVGEISPLAEKLIKATKTALEEAIMVCHEGKKTGDIGWVIENTVKNYGFSIADKLTGHGVGFEIHEDPSIYNFGEKGTGLELEDGLVIAIEPMVATGDSSVIENPDGSYTMKDGGLSAHFEKTIVITRNGPEVLTPIK